jgi:NAD(P)-dependent dehydrogenase (short-subunit alcohol dehydrogenase family)
MKQLGDKTAIIYGAAGAIGAAVSKALAAAGVTVYVTGRNKALLENLTKEIIAEGHRSYFHELDALDKRAVEEHGQMVQEREGCIDISFNAIGIPQTGVQGIPLLNLTEEQYLLPVEVYMKSHFITATAAARHMTKNGSGIIFTLTAVPSRLAAPLVGGMAPAWAGLEALTRTLAAEVGAHGVRVVCLRADGMPETETITTVFGVHASGAGLPSHKEFQGLMENFTLLKRLPRLNELAQTAVFLSSDAAGAITGTTINVTCGSVVD